jgi:hypothetical protein
MAPRPYSRSLDPQALAALADLYVRLKRRDRELALRRAHARARLLAAATRHGEVIDVS